MVGSIENKKHISKAFLEAPENEVSNEFYDFLNIKKGSTSEPTINKLKKVNIEVYNYLDEKDMINYCETII